MDLSAIVNQLSQLSTRSAQEVQAKMSAGDLNDPDKMIKAQFSMQQYSNFVSYESAMIKAVKDMIQGIISKI
ncbi:type III secretion system needle filament subunit SctF [Shewanella violacea]|uniref:Type III secretion system apparatus protein, putative n=1 Tax=Shewanella violacea (strain JCM 10179 / CIP 106290 / LMG 19151 / DSS12) TaxID=637905 RepID=D4ZKL6_SHEVD|nr:type III secretion system needle filament subunit SctF [Shewanella violacea]BAJ02215.1 type III secretion system apparatus protein, putative [Shewanella violacea DSS12]